MNNIKPMKNKKNKWKDSYKGKHKPNREYAMKKKHRYEERDNYDSIQIVYNKDRVEY